MTGSLGNVCALLMEWREGEPTAALETITCATMRSVRRRMERGMSPAELVIMTTVVAVLHATMLARGAGPDAALLARTTTNLGIELRADVDPAVLRAVQRQVRARGEETPR